MKYLKFGSSKNVIVFLHGWGADKDSFIWVKDYLDEYSLVFVDFAGFGETLEPRIPYFVSDYVSELRLLIDKLDIEDLVLVGHSFGGRVAIKFASIFESDYKSFKLILVDSAGIKPRRSINYYFRVYKYKLCKKLAKNNERLKAKLNKFGSSDYKKLSPLMKQTFINVVNEDLTFFAKQIKSDSLIVWGDKDTETKKYMARKLNKYIKNSKLYFIKGAGHFCFLDKPYEFLNILDTFLKN